MGKVTTRSSSTEHFKFLLGRKGAKTLSRKERQKVLVSLTFLVSLASLRLCDFALNQSGFLLMRPAILVVASLLFCLLSASAQTITTIAGTGKAENNGNEGAATSINIGDPFGVEFASDGSLYICEVRNHRVWRMSPKG